MRMEIRTPRFRHGARGPAAKPRARPCYGILNGIDAADVEPGQTDRRCPRAPYPPRNDLRSASPTSGRSSSVSASSRATGSLCSRGEPAHLAEGHGHAAGERRPARGRGRASWWCSARAMRRSKAGCWRGAARHRGKVGVVIGYNEPLCHLIQGGRRRHPDPVALRAVRADPALWPALWLRAGGQPRRAASPIR